MLQADKKNAAIKKIAQPIQDTYFVYVKNDAIHKNKQEQ
jgi:hypothetical protein